MKRMLAINLAAIMLLSSGMNVFAAENLSGNKSSAEIGVYAKSEYNMEGALSSEVEEGTANTVTEDNISIEVTNAPEGAVKLIVVPVPKTEKEAWDWITECVKEIATPIHTFEIYFEDQDGNRMDANGAVVTINCPHCTDVPMVCSLDTDGTVHVLNSSTKTRTVAVTFTTNGSVYYVMAEKATSEEPDDEYDANIKEPNGGDVEISDETPEAGDKVTIIPKPDEGKEVDKVIVRDEDGKEIPVTDNGDGTYSYEQPEGDVTIEVVFKDEDTTVPDDDKDTSDDSEGPTTGDSSNVWLWSCLLMISVMGFGLLMFYRRKEIKE